MQKSYQLGVIGYGNMAHAILKGAAKANLLSANRVLLYDPDESKTRSSGYASATQISELPRKCEFLLLSVKPQVYPEVLAQVRFEDNVLISIMAGISKARLRRETGCKVARIMPNTPALIGEGMAAIDADGLSEGEIAFVKALFQSVGRVLPMRDAEMDLVTAVSGSGPAYVYLFADAMIQAGIRLGLSGKTAKELALQTIVGAGKLAQSATEELSVLIDRVCSKGGTTIEAVKIFRERGLYELTDSAMEACYRRAGELSAL